MKLAVVDESQQLLALKKNTDRYTHFVEHNEDNLKSNMCYRNLFYS